MLMSTVTDGAHAGVRGQVSREKVPAVLVEEAQDRPSSHQVSYTPLEVCSQCRSSCTQDLMLLESPIEYQNVKNQRDLHYGDYTASDDE